MNHTISLIATVRNEIGSLPEWLAGIEQQTLQPDQVVIVDGGSTDGTLEALIAWARSRSAVVVSAPGKSISEGRNLAFARATGQIIAITDCGTVARPDWLERLVAPFSDPLVDVVSGFFVPVGESRWDRSLAAATLPDVDEIDPDAFLPSSRSVAIRSTWVQGGFAYPEWLDYCEDLIWDMQLRRAGARFRFAPDAIVSFAVRPDSVSFWHQYFRYARGDGKAGLFAKRHAVRYASYLLAGVVVSRGKPLELAGLVIAGMFHLRTPLRRLIRRDRAAGKSVWDSIGAVLVIPLQMVIGDVAKMSGYPVGLKWRKRRLGSLRPSRDWRRVNAAGDIRTLRDGQETEQRPTNGAAEI